MLVGNLKAWERNLAAHLAKLANKRLGRTITMIEVADAAGLWSDAVLELGPLLSGLDFETLLEDFPVLGCAAASEIGFRFEGVGTVFWAKFEGLLGRSIPVGQRPLLSRTFANLADRFALQRPSESGFATQFSIIAWPIANALMPYELAGPVSRLLARGPVSAVAAAASARRSDLSSLRAWAQSWEGARLADWLQPEGPAARVISALLSDNAKTALSAASYQRVKVAFSHQSDAYFALREARRRKSSASTAAPTEQGQLSLRRHGEDYALSVSWPALPQSLIDRGRKQASARGWRPRLWGQARTAADNMFGSLPITLRLPVLPVGTSSATPDAASVFEDDPEVSQALLARTVDWDSPLVFLREGDEAERVSLPLASSDGKFWILDPQNRFTRLGSEGVVAGAMIRRANLAVPEDREALSALNWLAAGSSSGEAIARSPYDAMTLPRRQVTAQAPFCLFDDKSARIEHLRRRETGAHGLSVAVARDAAPAMPGVFLFERETAFDALVEQRLLAKIQSPIAGARWPVEVMALIDEEIIAYAADELSDEGEGLARTSRTLSTLQADHVRQRILQAGRATLRVRVGRHPWDTVALRRLDGDVDWTQGDPVAALSRPAVEVVAHAPKPFRFAPPSTNDGACVRAFRFDDGRLAAPGRIEAPDHFGLGDLSSDFGEIEGLRRLRAEGGGILDLARARRSWATAETGNLAAVAARIRVVRQFDEPLVAALCGPQWRDIEQRVAAPQSPSQLLFDRILPAAVGDQPGELDPRDRAEFAQRFDAALGEAGPDWFDDGAIDDECADQALSDAFGAMLIRAQAEGRMLKIDVNDMDFGASADQWRSAAEAAIEIASRSPLTDLIAPTTGANVLARRWFAGGDLAEASSFLVDWTAEWSLPRSQIGLDVACDALQFWLTPSAADPESGALAAMSRDVFLARAVRYVAKRMRQTA